MIKTEYIDNVVPLKRLYYLNLDELDLGDTTSFWLDDENNIYRRIEAQDRFDLRKWQYNAAGNKNIVIKGKTLSYMNYSKL